MAIRRNGRRRQTPREMNGKLAPTNFGQPGVSLTSGMLNCPLVSSGPGRPSHAGDGIPSLRADPNWSPLANTPAHPEYAPAFERKMKKAGNIIDRYRNTLHSLAK
jgi:hypothetical protein